MSRLAQRFQDLRARGEGALIAYLMAGDPDLERSFVYAQALLAGGADVLELGVPFSDPVADGPTLQAAAGRALRQATTPEAVFELARRLRAQTPIPIVLMTYYNPVFKMGEEAFLKRCQDLGIDGVIVADLPPEEAAGWVGWARRWQIDTIFFATPESDEVRIRLAAEQTTGFLYVVARYGTTGARGQLSELTVGLVQRVRALTDLPLAVGFGLSTPDQVRTVIVAGADGAIVGSALVAKIAEQVSIDGLKAFVHALKEATRRPGPGPASDRLKPSRP